MKSKLKAPSLHNSPAFCYPKVCIQRATPLLWSGFRAARGTITISGIPICLNYCEKFTVCTQFKNMAAGRMRQHGGPRHRDPWRKVKNQIWATYKIIIIIINLGRAFARHIFLNFMVASFCLLLENTVL